MPNSFQISAYFQYLLHSGNRHSVHSPFVYQLLTETIAPRRNWANTEAIEALRAELYRDKRHIEVQDYGAGSHQGLGKRRLIKKIAKISGRSRRSGQLLYRLAHTLKPKNILELGTSLGLSTCYLAAGHPEAHIQTIEGCPETAKIAFENFYRLKIKNIKQRIGNFDELLPKILGEQNSIDMVLIDGNHRYQPTMQYLQHCIGHGHNHSLIVVDDIHWSEEMQQAWEDIKKHPKVRVTIDLFDLGLIFLRKEQVKQDFILRY